MDSGEPYDRLRTGMRRNAFVEGDVDLRRVVDSLDARSRKEGLHVLQSWDFRAHEFARDSTPIQLLEYCLRLPNRRMPDRAAVETLLDQYFFAVIALLAVRAWDEGDANDNLDRVSGLVRTVQGPGGSHQRFVDDAETLLFLAISYYHPEEDCYGRVLDRVKTLDATHRLRMAIPVAAMLGAHLRWGLRFMYGRDVGAMRADNVVDYPWMRFAVETLAAEHRRNPVPAVSMALIDGLSADPWEFVGTVSSQEIDELIGPNLLKSAPYWPLEFASNFPSNAAVARVAIALEDGASYPSLNVLFENGNAEAAELAERLMKWAASDPGRLGAGGVPLIVHDVTDGVRAANAVVRALREAVT